MATIRFAQDAGHSYDIFFQAPLVSSLVVYRCQFSRAVTLLIDHASHPNDRFRHNYEPQHKIHRADRHDILHFSHCRQVHERDTRPQRVYLKFI